MGMYDDVKYKGKWYQTKDTPAQRMHNYYIEDNRLLVSEGHNEDKSPATKWKSEHPGEELPDNLKGIIGMCGCLTWVETGKSDTDWNGALNFYDSDSDYTAVFIGGEMTYLTCNGELKYAKGDN